MIQRLPAILTGAAVGLALIGTVAVTVIGDPNVTLSPTAASMTQSVGAAVAAAERGAVPNPTGGSLAASEDSAAPADPTRADGDTAPAFAAAGDAPTFAAGVEAPSFVGGGEAPSFVGGDLPPAAAEGAPPFAESGNQEGGNDEGENAATATGDMPPPADTQTTAVPLGTALRVPADQKLPLEPAPIQGLANQTPLGVMPQIDEVSGLAPWMAYGRPFRDTTNRPRISLIMVGMGVNANLTQRALTTLPSAVSIAYPPYVRDLEYWAQQTRQVGHEVLLMVPMEPFEYPRDDPGPHTLSTALQATENRSRLEWVMTRFPGYVGLVNLMGGKFTSSEAHVERLLRVVKDLGLVFVEQEPAEFSVVRDVAGRRQVPQATADLTVDAVPSRAAIEAQLAELERIATERGRAVGIVHPYPVTIDTVIDWAATLNERDLLLAPITALTRDEGA